MMTGTAPRLLTPAEAGEIVGVSATVIRRWVDAGKLRHVDVGTPRYPRMRIREDGLARLIDTLTPPGPDSANEATG